MADQKVQMLNVLSLFSGCGGMDLGFEGDFDVIAESVNEKLHPEWGTSQAKKGWVHLPKTLFHTVFANDIREDAQLAWVDYFQKKGIKKDTFHLASIVDLVKEHRKNGGGVFPDNIDVVTGGFPCQDFSVAGKRKGFNSDKSHTGERITDPLAPSIESRGQLYMWLRDVVSITEPRIFIAENVKGLTNLSNAKQIIENDFRNINNGGYIVVEAQVLNAAEYGVPQSRERVIFIGFKKSALTQEARKALTMRTIPEEFNPYPIKTHYISGGIDLTGRKKAATVKEALKGLKEPNEAKDISQQKYSQGKYLGNHCQGQNEVNLDGIGPTIRSEHHGNIEYRRLSKEHGGRYDEELNKGMAERRLTVRECARLQTFPDCYEFVKEKRGQTLSASNAYKLIGNAVPPLLAYNIAKRLEENWSLYFGECMK